MLPKLGEMLEALQFDLRTKPELGTVHRITETETTPKLHLMSDSVLKVKPKLKFGRGALWSRVRSLTPGSNNDVTQPSRLVTI